MREVIYKALAVKDPALRPAKARKTLQIQPFMGILLNCLFLTKFMYHQEE